MNFPPKFTKVHFAVLLRHALLLLVQPGAHEEGNGRVVVPLGASRARLGESLLAEPLGTRLERARLGHLASVSLRISYHLRGRALEVSICERLVAAAEEALLSVPP